LACVALDLREERQQGGDPPPRREHGKSADGITKVADTVVVRDDPVADAATV
jgi:hypothetical protein